jgi:hypothetical protein
MRPENREERISQKAETSRLSPIPVPIPPNSKSNTEASPPAHCVHYFRRNQGSGGGESGSRAAALHTVGLGGDGFAAFQAGERLDGTAGFLLGEAEVVESL